MNKQGYLLLTSGVKIITTILRRTKDKIFTTSGDFSYDDIDVLKIWNNKTKPSKPKMIKIKTKTLHSKKKDSFLVRSNFYDQFKKIGKFGSEYVDELEKRVKKKEIESRKEDGE